MMILKNFYASAYKELHYLKRTIINTITSIFVFYIIFLMFTSGYKFFSGPIDHSSTMQSIIVAYYSWTMVLSVYTSMGYIISQNRSTGVLENLMLNSPNFTMLLILESFSRTIFYFLFSWINLFLFKLTTGVEMSFRFFSTGYILIIGLISILGVSLIVAGITIVLKNAGAVLTILQFAFLGLLSIRFSENILLQICLPFATAKQMLEKCLIEDISAFAMPKINHATLWANAILFLIIGSFIFNYFTNLAKKKGLLKFF